MYVRLWFWNNIKVSLHFNILPSQKRLLKFCLFFFVVVTSRTRMRFVIPLICSIATICGAASLPVESKDLKSEMWRARLEFSSNLLGALDHKGSDHNVVVSTFGLHSALSAVLAGAEGETYSQLWKALG